MIAELRGLAAREHAEKVTDRHGLSRHAHAAGDPAQRAGKPGWYTAYTPYQAEIAQGRLEALLNFQTMVSDLTGMQIANASLLDEATAAAEAMAMAHALSKAKSDVIAVATDLHPQTRAVLATRARPLGIQLVDVAPGDVAAIGAANPFALVLQYPGTTGAVRELSAEIGAAHEADALAIVATDPVGARAADPARGDGRRRGGRLLAALRRADGIRRAACRLLRHARCVQAGDAGAAGRRPIDAAGAPAMRLALQTREQHIRREKATSNICTAQVLLAVIAGLYAVLARARGVAPNCPASEPAGTAAGRCGAAGWAAGSPRRILRYNCD